jgi:hypothetical protein
MIGLGRREVFPVWGSPFVLLLKTFPWKVKDVML